MKKNESLNGEIFCDFSGELFTCVHCMNFRSTSKKCFDYLSGRQVRVLLEVVSLKATSALMSILIVALVSQLIMF